MRRTLSAALAASCVLALLAAAPAGQANAAPPTPDTFVTYWDEVGIEAVTAAALPPPDGHTVLAYVAVAVYDSVMAVSGRYEPFAINDNAPKGASMEAAVAASAHDVLAHYLPAQAPTIIDPALVDVAGDAARRQGQDRRHRPRAPRRRRLAGPARRRRIPCRRPVHGA